MNCPTPRFNIGTNKYEEFYGKRDKDWYSKKFAINPYSRQSNKAALFRGKQTRKLPWSKIVEDLEPYSLYPPEEIQRLLKLYSFFILHYVSKGYLIDIPYLGQVCGTSEEYTTPWKSKHKIFDDILNIRHDTIKFRPSPFAHWYFNPNIYTPYKYQRVPGYFRAFEKFQKELIHSGLNWYEIFPDKRYLEFSLGRLRHNGTIKQYAGMPWVEGRKQPSLVKIDSHRIPLVKKVIDTYGNL